MAEQLWPAAALVLGFQMAALLWRLNRELYMSGNSETIWIPLADLVIFASALVLVLGVFVLPTFFGLGSDWAMRALGISLALFVLSPVIVAAHYDLFPWSKSDGPRPHITEQEGAAIVIVLALVALLVVLGALWWIFASS